MRKPRIAKIGCDESRIPLYWHAKGDAVIGGMYVGAYRQVALTPKEVDRLHKWLSSVIAYREAENASLRRFDEKVEQALEDSDVE